MRSTILIRRLENFLETRRKNRIIGNEFGSHANFVTSSDYSQKGSTISVEYLSILLICIRF